MTLLRSSYDPDPYPELGLHHLRFAIRLAGAAASNKDLVSAAYDYTHPLDVISGAGRQPVSDSFLSLESGSAAVSAIKAPEEGESGELVVRLYETAGQTTPVKLKFSREVLQAVPGRFARTAAEGCANGENHRQRGIFRYLCQLHCHTAAKTGRVESLPVCAGCYSKRRGEGDGN